MGSIWLVIDVTIDYYTIVIGNYCWKRAILQAHHHNVQDLPPHQVPPLKEKLTLKIACFLQRVGF